jgi:microcystin-dependent protein
MNLELPQPGADDNVWDDKINTAFEQVDSHDHTDSKGVKIPVAGINIDDNLPLNGFSTLNVGETVYTNQTTASTNVCTVRFKNGDLYCYDSSGTEIRITSGGSLNVSLADNTNTPAGMVVDYAGAVAPAGYLLCDGSTYLWAQYPALRAAIGITYGGTAGVDYKVPDLRGRATAGKDDMGGTAAFRLTSANGLDGTILGQDGGVQRVTLTQLETPLKTHTHTASSDSAGAHTHTLQNLDIMRFDGGDLSLGPKWTNGGSNVLGNTTIISTVSAGAHTHTINIGNASDATANSHQNVQPTLILNKIIKT